MPESTQVSPSHIASAPIASLMTGVAVVGPLYRPDRIRDLVGWASPTRVGIFQIRRP